MKVTFFSNYINHHQIPLSEAFISMPGIDYRFVATEEVPQEKINIGYPKSNEEYDYVIAAYKDENSKRMAVDLAQQSDIVILGSASDNYIVKRLADKKITFRYCERYFRKGWNIKTIPRYFASAMYHHRRFQNKPLYYLCSSAYTPADVNTFSNYIGRQYKWGYFPRVEEYNLDEIMGARPNNQKIRLLWVARMLQLKHPESALYVAKKLKEDGIQFELQLIGSGEIENDVRNSITTLGLNNDVKMLGKKSPEDVREFMKQSDIFLFTSDFQEGWGAVVNEAMNCACAVVVSHAVGAAPYLIKNGSNGYIYKYGDNDELYKKAKELILNPELRRRIQKNAYNTMIELWNANIAATRLIRLFEEIRAGNNTPYTEGPCSIADNIKEEDMYDYIMRGL